MIEFSGFHIKEKPKTPFIAVFILLMLKMFLLRYFFFHDIMWTRITADAAALFVLLGLFELILPAKGKGPVYWVINLVLSFLMFASAVYFQHFNSVPTYSALSELHQVTKIKDSVKSTIEPENFLFFLDLAVIAIVWIIGRFTKWKLPVTTPLKKRWAAVIFIVGLAASAYYIKTDQSITNELVQAEHLGFINYQVAAGIKANKENAIIASGNLEETVQKIDSSEQSFPYQDKPETETPAYFGAAKGKNVIVVQMEAFQNFPIHLKLGDTEVTPVLNSLADESFYFPHFFQQIGQGNTSDAEFMSNTSIYPTGTTPMSTGFGDRKLPSLPRLLENLNYEADTFHVNNVTFWDRDQLYPALNFDHYYDKPSYKNDHFNEFGASDEELYRVGLEKLLDVHQQNKPFYAQFVTASSHFPFRVPNDRKKITIPESLKGKQIGDYIEAVNYTDYALGTLIDSLKKEGLWDDTVLVVYGDHFGLQPQDNDPAVIGPLLGITYDPYVSRFNIPLIIHVPGQQGKVVDQVGGQIDIMPTVANLLGISLKDNNFTAFGHDLLNIDQNVFGMRYYLPTGSFFNNDILFIPGKGFDDGKAISIKTLQPVQDFTKYRKDYDYVLDQMKLSDQYVNMLPRR